MVEILGEKVDDCVSGKEHVWNRHDPGQHIGDHRSQGTGVVQLPVMRKVVGLQVAANRTSLEMAFSRDSDIGHEFPEVVIPITEHVRIDL